MSNITPTTSEDVELILNIVAKKLVIDVDEVREKAIKGTLSGVTKAYYSREQPSLDEQAE